MIEYGNGTFRECLLDDRVRKRDLRVWHSAGWPKSHVNQHGFWNHTEFSNMLSWQKIFVFLWYIFTEFNFLGFHWPWVTTDLGKVCWTSIDAVSTLHGLLHINLVTSHNVDYTVLNWHPSVESAHCISFEDPSEFRLLATGLQAGQLQWLYNDGGVTR